MANPGTLHRAIAFLAQAMALLGGLVLCLTVAVVCASVAGRGIADLAQADTLGRGGVWLLDLGVGPISGDFELVEAGMAFAIFAFLPLTQLSGAHASVDVFTSRLGPRTNHALDTMWSIVMAAVIMLIAWRLYAALGDKYRYGETTYLIQFPIWWAYAASFAAALVACIVSLYCTAMRLTGGR